MSAFIETGDKLVRAESVTSISVVESDDGAFRLRLTLAGGDSAVLGAEKTWNEAEDYAHGLAYAIGTFGKGIISDTLIRAAVERTARRLVR